MEITEIEALLTDFEKLKSKISAAKGSTDTTKYMKQYNTKDHDVTSTTERPDRLVETTVNGVATPSLIKKTRLVLPMQKNIVNLAAAFLCGNPIKLNCTPADDKQRDLLSVIHTTWLNNKLDYESKTIAKKMMSECEVAEIWYAESVDAAYWDNTPNAGRPFRLRMRIVAKSLNDELYPVFNNMGDMVAFGREYTVKVDDKDVQHYDLYTDKKTYLATRKPEGWDIKPEDNFFGKIPVIYYSQPLPEWNDVQSLIDRFEKLISNHSDANDRHLFPMIKVSGKLKGAPIAGESGNILEMENGADANYMEWKQITQSLELELKNLRSLIFDMTSTPDISIEQMKALGTYSGIALKMLFLAPHMKAADKEETFGKCIQRRINLIKAAMAKINATAFEKSLSLEIAPQFEYFLPKNDAEIIDMLVSATGSKPIMTAATAVRKNPLVDDADQEIAKLKEETVVDVNTLP